jgi:hypothetical protein
MFHVAREFMPVFPRFLLVFHIPWSDRARGTYHKASREGPSEPASYRRIAAGQSFSSDIAGERKSPFYPAVRLAPPDRKNLLGKTDCQG